MKKIHLCIITFFLGCICTGIGVVFFHNDWHFPKVNRHTYSPWYKDVTLYTQRRQKHAFCQIPDYSVVLWSALDTPQDFCNTQYSLVYIWIRSSKGEEYILNGVRSLSLQCRVTIFWDPGYDTIHPELLQPWKEIIFPIGVDENYHIINTPYDDINLLTPEWWEKREEFLQEHYQFLQTLPECEPNMK